MEGALAALSFALVIAVNSLASATDLLGGVTTAEVSAKYETLLTPRGYVFSIWFLIYFLLGLFLYRALRGAEVSSKVLRLIALSNLLNVLWIFLWHYGLLELSLIANLALFSTVALIYLEQDKRALGARAWTVEVLPFSIYLGWLVVAVTANMAALLRFWEVGAQEVWASAALYAASGVAIALGLLRKDFVFPAVLSWALWGIEYPRELALFALSLTATRIFGLVALLVALLLFLMRFARR